METTMAAAIGARLYGPVLNSDLEILREGDGEKVDA